MWSVLTSCLPWKKGPALVKFKKYALKSTLPFFYFCTDSAPVPAVPAHAGDAALPFWHMQRCKFGRDVTGSVVWEANTSSSPRTCGTGECGLCRMNLQSSLCRKLLGAVETLAVLPAIFLDPRSPLMCPCARVSATRERSL